MKVRKLVRKLYKAVRKNDKSKEKALYFELLKKSIRQKKTQVVR